MAEIKCIGIVTSGNDAPGMNAAVRAVTRSAIYNGFRVKAVFRGYKGLIDGDIHEFKTQNVSSIIHHGGTILKSSPSKDFRSEEGRKKAFENMKNEEIDALIVIGGDGSITGARIFAQEYDIPCIGIPATIDNNLFGTFLELTPQSGTTLLSTQLWSVSIKSGIPLLRMNASSLSKLWATMRDSWLLTGQLHLVVRRLSFLLS